MGGHRRAFSDSSEAQFAALSAIHPEYNLPRFQAIHLKHNLPRLQRFTSTMIIAIARNTSKAIKGIYRVLDLFMIFSF